MNKKGKILLIDDNEDVLFALNALLLPYVEKIKVSTNPEKIEHFLQTHQPDIIFLDMNFREDVVSGKEGFDWLEKILQIDPKAIVIFMTAYADTEKAVQAIKSGATDFISKPWEKEKLLATLFSALKLKESQNEIEHLKVQIESLSDSAGFPEIIGESESMQEVFSIVEKLAETDANVLILGENGTGKDLIARAIHQHSSRANHVFINIDLGTIPETLFESELFGYEKGAFTDAKKDKAGRMEIASGGTLFLDEIGNLSLPMQAKLLTAIEKKQISRLGANATIPINVRYITATNKDLYEAVENAEFRQDLLYRINTIEIHIPPLRERGNDIILLAEHFLQKFSRKYKKDTEKLSYEAKTKLMSYGWQGNVRELQNVMERAVVLSNEKTLKAENIVLQTKEGKKKKEIEFLNLEELEQMAINKAMKQCSGNMNEAAKLLGITRYALYRKINK
ncbi:MAG: sigma-54 dependent transcriptional regulator [Dysgonamonadaceae bacterium]|jgi:DNA-binding NtrC family response regulator|nr:sigma-54 dependent transcriptional regulator [Dysgonamonadaceae bacterium]